MATPKTWTFRQLGGDRKELTLAGAAAPHGRPRQKPVVSDGIKVRQSKTMYPGSSIPTRHIFGTECEDLELAGRWRDQDLGPGGAATYVSLMKDFVAAQQPISVSWGDAVIIRGLAVNFVPSRESEAEIPWTLKIEVDSDDSRAAIVRSAPPVDPQGYADKVAQMLTPYVNFANPTKDIEISPSFLDTLDDVVSSLNGASASFLKAAFAIDNFEQATADSLKRLVAGAGQLKTALLTFQQTMDTTRTDAALLRDASKSNILWFEQVASAQVNTFAASALLTELGVRAETAQTGSIGTTYTAQYGDTWESLATRFLGGPSAAERLRVANGAKFGQQPTPGALLRIPTR
jgi:hypothetical protein